MNSFSINRFGQMLGWLVNVNRVRLLGFTAGIMSSTFLIQIMMFVFGPSEGVLEYTRACVNFGSFFIPYLILFVVCLTYSSFTSIGNKQQRGTWLMIPATNLEKFLSLIVYVTVICGLCAIVGYILGDCLRMASLWIWAQFSSDPGAAAGEVFNYNGEDVTYYLWSSTVYRVFCNMIPHAITVWSSASTGTGANGHRGSWLFWWLYGLTRSLRWVVRCFASTRLPSQVSSGLQFYYSSWDSSITSVSA